MAGHSKWNNIKNKKGAADAKRGKLFSQLSKQIKSAVKEGQSGDPNHNPALRLVMDKARQANMPKDNIQRAIDRGLGKSSSGASFQEILYEGYASGGVGILVQAVTDNPNRTGTDVRTAFTHNGGSLGGPGSVSYMFEHKEGEYVCTMPMTLEDEPTIKSVEKVIDILREIEEVEDVYCSATWPGQSDEE